ncbi:MAG TPA: hypothetical protein P5318_07245 [Candidatus Hydrogenedentes bacterium]|nr:hypothetical protein [Candidatus Hydrogenedentota bacterium]HPC15957.1 hypothetical protein [Candidatus Hydrogenedentota bacterium]HRT19911.1 hypothetical protein [Candidatus Hydrogenedentota bacterium]HRT66340.1 hypothetical protein [Candidatus Hydrogenedentota bacterium]
MWWAGLAIWMAAAADTPAVNAYATLDPPVIPFHRQARFTVVVETPKDIDPKLPDMIDKFGGLAVADIHRETTPLKGGARRITETYTLDPVFAKEYVIAAADVTWGDGNSAVIPSLALLVRAPTDDEVKQIEAAAATADVAAPLGIPDGRLRGWRIGALAGAVVLAAAGAGYFYWRGRRKPAEPPPVPPWEIAYRRLRELDQRQWPKAGKHEPYYVDLSAILRYYIEDRFSVHAPEQTTQEFLAAAAVAGIFNESQQQLLSGFLKHCDRVKFAQYIPTLAEMEHCFSVVLQFVDETVPRPQAETPAQEAAA